MPTSACAAPRCSVGSTGRRVQAALNRRAPTAAAAGCSNGWLATPARSFTHPHSQRLHRADRRAGERWEGAANAFAQRLRRWRRVAGQAGNSSTVRGHRQRRRHARRPDCGELSNQCPARAPCLPMHAIFRPMVAVCDVRRGRAQEGRQHAGVTAVGLRPSPRQAGRICMSWWAPQG